MEASFSNSLRFETQLLKKLQRVIVVNSATHPQKDGVEGNGGSLKDVAEALVLFLRGAQLVLRSSVLAVLDPDEVNVTLENADTFVSMLSGEGGSVGGGWRCCRSAPGLPQLPPATPKSPPSFVASLLLFCFCGDQYSIRTAGR